jgi:FkbM family methyltransferase
MRKLYLEENLKNLMFQAMIKLVKTLSGSGIGRIPFILKLYQSFSKRIIPESSKTVSIEGFQIKIDTSARGLDGMGTALMTCSYEPVTTSVFKKVLHTGMNVIDVGANIGYYSLISSKLVGNGRVVAVEPELTNFSNLQKNILLNGFTNIETINAAASDKSGIGTLFISKNESGEHSLVRGRDLENSSSVRIITLDEEIKRDYPVGLIKTDTEGNDLMVLRGAKDILKNNDRLIIITEYWLPGITKLTGDDMSYYKFLNAQGFTNIYIADEIRKEIAKGSFAEIIRRCSNGKFSVNLVCSRYPLDIL